MVCHGTDGSGWHKVTISGSEVYGKSLKQKQLKTISSINQGPVKLFQTQISIAGIAISICS